MMSIFLWQATIVIEKYQTKLTSLQESLKDSGTLRYPSVTFCSKYTWESFPGVLEILNKNMSMDFYDIKNFAQSNYWTREKVFTFFSHQSVVPNNSFPCNTVGGSKTGKPCSFPFIYKSVLDDNSNNDTNMNETKPKTVFHYFDQCSVLDDVTPWCYTRTQVNLTYIVGHWGYCLPECEGEKPYYESKYNLAMDDKHWEIGLFDLSSWGSGVCHTYNPPRDVEPGVSGQLYTLLGDKEKNFAIERVFMGFNIYLHDKGQFWPGLEMARIGLSKELFLPKNTQFEGSFQVRQKTLINKDDSPCSEDPNYSFQSCIFKWVAKDAGCHLDWFSPVISNGSTPCTRREDIGKYNDALTTALQARWLKLQNMTGCIPKCTVRTFSFVENTKQEANWGRNWSAAFFLDVKTSSFVDQTEFEAYDIFELISGLGGLMGIFLGWSFLFLIVQIYQAGEVFCIKFWMKDTD